MSNTILYVCQVFNKILQIKDRYILNENTKKFIAHCKKIWKEENKIESNNIILVDFYGVPETEIARSYFLNILSRKFNAVIKSYSIKNMHNRVLSKVYNSFNVKENIISKPDKKQKKLVGELVGQYKIKSKRDLHNFTIKGIWVGIDIYETYLARRNKATPDFNDKKLMDIFYEGIGLVIFWDDFFKENNVKAVVSSHDCYLTYNVLCKVAYKYKVPVYFPNPIYLNRATNPFDLHSHFPYYHELFEKLTFGEQQNGITWAKNKISKKISGIENDISYSMVSSFSHDNKDKRYLKESGNVKVLICSHCFFDNPSGYGNTMFTDFYEWLSFLGGISNQTDYDWYLKMHPDPISGTYEIMREILKKYPKIELLPHSTSHIQLAREGLDFALTVYGTIGQEYPALGVQVINAGYNPRVAYKFNLNPKTIVEYKDVLLNLDTVENEINLEELYEFYFMHQKYIYIDNLIFDSYDEFKKCILGKNTSYAYAHFMNSWTEHKHKNIIATMEKFIDAKVNYYFSGGIEG